MPEPLKIQLNGQSRAFDDLNSSTDLATLIDTLTLKADRIAVELDGEIVPRAAWAGTQVNDGARLEIVHFVGGGKTDLDLS